MIVDFIVTQYYWDAMKLERELSSVRAPASLDPDDPVFSETRSGAAWTAPAGDPQGENHAASR